MRVNTRKASPATNGSSPLTLAVILLALLFTYTVAARGQAESASQADTLRAQYKQSLKDNRPLDAIGQIKQLLAINPDDIEGNANLGVLYYFKSDCAAADPYLKGALAAKPDLYRIQLLLARCEMRLNQIPDARLNLEAILPHLKGDNIQLEVGADLVNLYMSSGDLEKAAATIDLLQTDFPLDRHVLYMAFRIHTEMVQKALLKLSVAAPDSAQMDEAMAYEKLMRGDIHGAVAQYREALKKEPDVSTLHFELGEALSQSDQQTDKAAAEQEYLAALKINPFEENAERKIAEFALEKEEYQGAYDHFSHALLIAPNDLDAQLGAARALVGLRRAADAQLIVESMLRAEPENDSAHLVMSRIYALQGRKDEARKEVDLYKHYKAVKEKMRGLYKELRISPAHLPDDASGKP